jgi:hypothetical protein
MPDAEHTVIGHWSFANAKLWSLTFGVRYSMFDIRHWSLTFGVRYSMFDIRH